MMDEGAMTENYQQINDEGQIIRLGETLRLGGLREDTITDWGEYIHRNRASPSTKGRRVTTYSLSPDKRGLIQRVYWLNDQQPKVETEAIPLPLDSSSQHLNHVKNKLLDFPKSKRFGETLGALIQGLEDRLALIENMEAQVA